LTIEQDALFEDTYSPSLVRFWLVPDHYLALIVLAEGSSVSDEAEYLAYEWQLIREGYHRDRQKPPGCLCVELHRLSAERKASAYPTVLHGGGGSGDARGRSARIKADLEQATDTLPIRWQETRRLYAVQQRSPDYFRRVGLLNMGQTPRPQDAIPEPEGSRWSACRWIARELGWRPEAKGVAA